MYWESIAKRQRQPEIMDAPDLEAPRHEAALRGLARLNALSASARIVWAPIADLARHLRTNRLSVLDVATGAGDIPLALWHASRKSGIHLDLHGVDVSDRALEFARRRAEASSAPIRLSRMDAVTAKLPEGFDVIISSLFLHHLDDAQARDLLTRMGSATKHLVLINDLRRCRRGWLLAYAAGSLFTRSDVVHVDAPRSVRAAFTLSEVRGLADLAGLVGAVVRPKWPCRFLLSWRCPAEPAR